MLSQVQGSCPLGFPSGQHRTGSYPHWESGLQTQAQQALASSPPRAQGEWRAWHLKNAGRKRAVFCVGRPKRNCESFNIPCPPAPPPFQPLPHFLPLSQKNPFISHFPTCSRTEGVSAQIHAVCSPNAAGSGSPWGHFRITWIWGISLWIQADDSKERTVLSSFVFRFDISGNVRCQSQPGHTSKHKRVSVLSRYPINRLCWHPSTGKFY